MGIEVALDVVLSSAGWSGDEEEEEDNAQSVSCVILVIKVHATSHRRRINNFLAWGAKTIVSPNGCEHLYVNSQAILMK